MRKLETPVHLAEKCKDESAALAARRWMCRFCDLCVKFRHREKTGRPTVWACVRLCVRLCAMERSASICWGDFPCPQTGIEVNSSAVASKKRVQTLWAGQEHVSDCAKSAASRPFLRVRLSAGIQAEVWSLCHWPRFGSLTLPIGTVSLSDVGVNNASKQRISWEKVLPASRKYLLCSVRPLEEPNCSLRSMMMMTNTLHTVNTWLHSPGARPSFIHSSCFVR